MDIADRIYLSGTPVDRYIGKMPAKLWPKLQIPFRVLATLMLLL